MFFCDAHCDTLQKLTDYGGDLYKNSYHVDIERIIDSGLGYVQVFAAFIDRKNSVLSPYNRCNQLISTYIRQINNNKNFISHCNSYEDLRKTLKDGKISSLLAIEGGEALEGDIDNVAYFYSLGVRLLTLTWNYDNELCGGIGDDSGGLSDFGKAVINKMNELGMIVDISHISNKGFWDVAEYSHFPLVATHSNSKSVCMHKRNLSDDQIAAIIKSGGFIGINLYSEFISENSCTIKEMINHIEHILSLGGEDCIGFGCDFDGVSKLPDKIAGVENISCLISELQRIGYADLLIKKITSLNFLKVVKKILV